MIDETGASQMLLPEAKRKKTIGVKEIEDVIAKMARIPPKSVSKNDQEALRDLETNLKHVVYGQDHAISALAAVPASAVGGLGNSTNCCRAPACAIRKSRSAATCSQGQRASARPRSHASSPRSWASS